MTMLRNIYSPTPIGAAIAASIILWLSSLHAIAGSPVWKISKEGQHIYLGGTIHLLAEADLPLPSQFNKAYSESSTLIFETDMAALKTPEFMAKIMRVMAFSDGQTLQSALRPEVYVSLQEYLKKRGIPEANLAMLTPTGAGLTIQLLEYQILGMNPDLGVDTLYTQKANSDGKTIGQLETPQEQLAFLKTMGQGKENEMVMQILSEAETMGEKINELKNAWRIGDNAKLAKLAITDMKNDFPYMYDTLLTQRNNTWLPKIEAMLKDNDVEFVLVGAMHLVGEDGLLQSLRKNGYDLENL